MMNLLLSALLLVVCHEGDSKGITRVFLFSYILGYSIELLGIKTGFPFGNYYYGHSLGPRLFDVPLVIGVNWFLMVMGGGYLAKRVVQNKVARIIMAALFMVIVDFLIESIAPQLNYWYWKDDIVPFANFAGWFVVAILMQIVFFTFMSNSTNKLGIPYIVVVTVFFGMLNLTL